MAVQHRLEQKASHMAQLNRVRICACTFGEQATVNRWAAHPMSTILPHRTKAAHVADKRRRPQSAPTSRAPAGEPPAKTTSAGRRSVRHHRRRPRRRM
eukprot:3157752-Prymnesium_polylepis.1